MSLDEIESPLDRARRRFERSHAIYEEAFEGEEFHDLVAVVVTGAFYETLLWNAVILDGYVAIGAKDRTLKQLVNEALNRGLVDQRLSKALRDFADIRNDFAHNIDCQLDSDRIDALEANLPDEYREQAKRCLHNMPGYGVGSKARVVFGELAGWSHKSLSESLRAKLGVGRPGPRHDIDASGS